MIHIQRFIGIVFLCLLTKVNAELKQTNLEELLEMDIEELMRVKIVTASRYEQHIYNSASVISVIHREDILRYGGNSLLDVLQYFPGFVPVGDRAFGLHGAMFRGDLNASGEHILTLLDGQPYRSMQSAQDSTSALYRSFPLSAIERIELIHGPGSAIYGTNAMTAVINIITRKNINDDTNNNTSNDTNNETVSELTLQEGYWGSHKQTFHLGAQHQSWLTRVTVENYKTDGWPITEDNRNTPPGTPFNSIEVDKQVLHAIIENSGFHLRSFLVNYETLFPEFGADAANTDQRYWNVGYQRKQADWEYAVDLGFLKVNNTLTGNEIDRNHSFEASAKKQLGKFSNWLFGLSASEADNKADGLNVDFHQIRYAAFTQVDFEVNETWTGLAGIQWNKIETGKDNISPRLGTIYHHSESQGIKLLYNEAFRSPTASETDVQFFIFTPAPVLIVSGNPDLEPETVKTFDLQWFSYGKRTLLTLGAFYSRYKDRVYQRPFGALFPGSPLTYLNGETVDMWGLELHGKWRLTSNNQFEAAWTWQKNQSKSGVYDSTLAPRWTANIGYSHYFENNIVVSLFNKHVSEFGDNGSTTTMPNPDSDSYDLLTVNVRVPLAPGYSKLSGIKGDMVFLIQNALDEDVWQPESAVNTTNTFQTHNGRLFYTALEMRW